MKIFVCAYFANEFWINRNYAFIEFCFAFFTVLIQLAQFKKEYDGRVLRVDVADAPRGRDRRAGGGRAGGFGGRGAAAGGGGGGGSMRGGGQPFKGGSSRSGERGAASKSDDFGRPEFSRPEGPGFGRSVGRGRGQDGADFVAHPSAPGRPRLQLKPRTTDPAELEKLKKLEEEETKKRQARIFQAKD
ncbi:unnamed protein product [Gongylonema pulchrum]|uniref:HABP4_PAI-RBP1 domain-containing protein n=1 Tax=Gongylonema pulchrum TaxID=637853 RepID=A0A183EU96_9BILA|nr:unnamed protein product [Gongylonema pulchrum]